MQVQRPKSPNLCSQCIILVPLLVDISRTPKSGDSHTKWWNETYIKAKDGIRGLTPTTCELCRILHNAFSRVPGFDPDNTQIKVSQRSFAKYKGFEHCGCMFEACRVRVALAPFFPVVKTDDGKDVNAFTGRPILPVMNPLLPKYWMTGCEAHAACKPDYSSKDFGFPFRLIDVQAGRLVEAPPNARYVALSYVWGGVKQVMLNKTTRKFLEREGSLTPDGLTEPNEEYAYVGQVVEAEGRVVPQTIRDAIRLCQLIDERYLWTDSLCIMQDDEFQDSNGAWTNADKLAQIPKMDIIYGASAITVIAACGADSNAGLPGVRMSNTRTAQTVGKIGDQIFVSVAYDPMDAFWQSKWCERAWTFQEFLLSKRHLIFLPEQVVFHCHTRAWSEDHSLEPLDSSEGPVETPAWTKSYKLRPMQLPVRSIWAENIFFPTIFINQFYSEWLKNFLKRRLTVASDILFAFDGALSASRRYLGSFHHGIPVDYFCESLHWDVGVSSMYLGKDPHQGITQRRQGFPSWSWTGWMWDIAHFEEFSVYYSGKVPEQWCRVGIWGTMVSADGVISLWGITSRDVKGWEKYDFLPASAFQVEDDWINEELPIYLKTIKTSPTPSNCLVLKTCTSSIFVTTQRQNPSSSEFRVFSSPETVTDNLVGAIKFPNKWQERIKESLELQVIITGSFFNGPDTRFPDQTDEMDPSIQCLVVEDVGDGQFERISRFVAQSSLMRKMGWKPIVAVLR